MDRKDIERAKAFAARAHEGQVRKSTRIPYIEHPLRVASILEEMGCAPETIIAGLLHDTTEDTDITLDRIVEEFGVRVAEIVAGCCEPDRSLPWEDRKAHTIGTLRDASFDAALVSAADKLDNLRSIERDLARIGDQVWSRFNRGRNPQAWYYRGVLEGLRSNPTEISSHAILDLLEEQIACVFGMESR